MCQTHWCSAETAWSSALSKTAITVHVSSSAFLAAQQTSKVHVCNSSSNNVGALLSARGQRRPVRPSVYLYLRSSIANSTALCHDQLSSVASGQRLATVVHKTRSRLSSLRQTSCTRASPNTMRSVMSVPHAPATGSCLALSERSSTAARSAVAASASHGRANTFRITRQSWYTTVRRRVCEEDGSAGVDDGPGVRESARAVAFRKAAAAAIASHANAGDAVRWPQPCVRCVCASRSACQLWTRSL